MNPQMWKIVGSGAAMLAGMIATKVVNGGWEKAVGKTPPSDPTDPDVDWKEALAFAALSGLVIGVAKLATQRQTAKFYTKAVGREYAELHNIKEDAGLEGKKA